MVLFNNGIIKRYAAFLILTLLLFTVNNAFCLGNTDAIVLLSEGASFSGFKAVLKELNVRADIFISPNSVYIHGLRDDILRLKGVDMVKSVHLSDVDTSVGGFSKSEKIAVNFFNYKRDLDAGRIDGRTTAGVRGGDLAPPRDVLRHSKRDSIDITGNLVVSTSSAKPADFYFTSEYLIGDVAVAVILPESDGTYDESTEDWDETNIQRVLNEIYSALTWWSERAAGKNLTFYVKTYIQVPTKYEIINMTAAGSMSDEPLWIEDILNNIGYTEDVYPASEYDYFDKAFAFANNMRKGYEDSEIVADWAISFIIIDSNNDEDGKFANDYFAYSYLGGPFTVMTFDNYNYTVGKMKEVALHEMAHQFYALDEYASAYEPCESRSGYLAIDNQNSEYGECFLDEICVMRDLGRATFPYVGGLICDYSRGHIGWYDSDSNGVYDPVDTYPSITVDPFEEGAKEFSGTVSVTAYPNSNPLVYPKQVQRIDISINTIALLQYRLDDGFWEDIPPFDGELGGVSEQFTFAPKPPRTDCFTLEIKAVNSAGNETKYVVGEEICLESTADTDTVSLISCFISEASYKREAKSNTVIILLKNIANILLN